NAATIPRSTPCSRPHRPRARRRPITLTALPQKSTAVASMGPTPTTRGGSQARLMTHAVSSATPSRCDRQPEHTLRLVHGKRTGLPYARFFVTLKEPTFTRAVQSSTLSWRRCIMRAGLPLLLLCLPYAALSQNPPPEAKAGQSHPVIRQMSV